MRFITTAVTALTLLALVGTGVGTGPVTPAVAQDKTDGKDPVVAIIDGDKILLSEVKELYTSLPERYRRIPLERLYQPLLERLIAIRVMSKAARAAKVQDDPALKKRLAQLEQQLLYSTYVNKLVDEKVTDEALRERYAEFVKNYKGAEQVKASHILVKTKKEAQEIIAELEKGVSFDKLARARSKGPSASRGGDLGYFEKGQMVKPFAEAAFNLKNGEYTKTPVQTQFGYHVILVNDRRTKPAPPFDQLKTQLRADLAEKIEAAAVEEERKKAKIERFNMDGTPLADDEAPKKTDDKKDIKVPVDKK